jgi:hypothetical protein
MSLIIIPDGTELDITTVDNSNTYLVESNGTLAIDSGGVVSGLITVEGQLLISGTAFSTIIEAGAQTVYRGGTAVVVQFEIWPTRALRRSMAH